MRIDKATATAILIAEATAAHDQADDRSWDHSVEQLSKICEGASKTHIAFLGTAMLAKATNLDVDVFSVKAGAGTHGSYSARGLAHGVLVPTAAKLGLNLGVSGREPLNNQPYFRIARATGDEMLPLVRDTAPVRALIEILERLQAVRSTAKAREALRAYIRVRRRYQPRYPTLDGDRQISIGQLTRKIVQLVSAGSEGGKRAQAIAAGLMDIVFSEERVHSGRINDPDRHLPGDVGVRNLEDTGWERTFEVRDKPVTESDLFLFAGKCAKERVPKAAMLAISVGQPAVRTQGAIEWATERGVGLKVYVDWPISWTRRFSGRRSRKLMRARLHSETFTGD